MATLSRTVSSLIFLCLFLGPAGVAFAQERPYFVTYDDQLEKRGELEVELLTTSANVRDENRRYIAPWTEIEYGVTSWWTAELYIEGVTFGGAGSAFTGWRWENRFRPIKGDHLINPVLYIEYENINEASRIQKEIVGRGAQDFESVNQLADARAHELEGRLILSSGMGPWNVSENLVVEKNLSTEEGFEFGYTVGVARSFGSGIETCRFCAGAFIAAIEAYGGLGTTASGASGATRQFISPVLSWHVTPGSLLKASVGFGLTSTSDKVLLRIGYTFDVELW